MKWRKKIWFLLLCSLAFLVPVGFANTSPAPNFEKDFANKLTDSKSDERVFAISCISKNNSFKANVECLFFPGKNSWGYLRNIVKYIGMLVVFIMIVSSAISLLMKAKKWESIKKAATSLFFILVGSAFFFGAMWLFGTIINLNSLQTTNGLEQNLSSSGGLIFFLLSFLKGLAFFMAILMIVVTGFKMMNPQAWESGDSKKLAKNLINIIFALVGMKVIDFIYYIASQQNFAQQVGDFIIQSAKFLAYLSGSVIVIMIIYSWYLLVVDGGKGENFKKAKNTLINIALGVSALFFFLFIIYQIFSEFN